MNIQYNILFSLLFVSGSLQAQLVPTCTASLLGDIRTGQPNPTSLPGATIYIRSLQRGTVADSAGHFRLNNLCPGIYTVEYRFVGFNTISEQIQLPFDSVRAVTLTSDAVNLPGVDVTEHRSEARQLLQTQTELSGVALDQTRGQSLGESLKNITGLYSIQTGPGISKPVIRGLYSNRILVLNNGIRQEDQQWGSEHAPQVDQFVASRLTVIKGAASIRYGSDAIGGVILVEPKAMPSAPGVHGEVNAVGSTNGRVGAASAYLEGSAPAGRFNKKLAGLSRAAGPPVRFGWRVQGTLKRAGYARAPGYFLENTGFRERNFSGDLHYDRTAPGNRHWGGEVYYSQFNNRIGLFRGAQVGSLSDLYAAITRPEPLVHPSFSYDLGRPYQDIQHQLIKARTYYRSDRFGELTLTVAQQQNRREEFDLLSFSRVETPELYLKLTTQTADLIWEHPTKRDRFDGVWSGSVGLNALTQSNIRRYLFLIPNYRANAVGGFAIERYARNRWVFEGGLRYDVRTLNAFFLDESTNRVFSRSHQWDNANGSLGISYQLHPNLLLTTNLGTAWRAPNASDLYANGLHQSGVAYERGNPNLKPEQAYNGNLDLTYSGKRLSAEISLFNNLINNYIYLKPDSVPTIRQRGAYPAYSYDQVRAMFRGIDATVSYKLTQQLKLTSKTSLLWAYDKTNRNYLVLVPPNRMDNSLRYDCANQTNRLSGLYVQISALAVARQNRVPAVSSEVRNGVPVFRGDFASPPPGYFLLNAETGLNLLVGKQPLSVILTGANLLNTAYRDYLNRFRYFADEPGRNLSLKIKMSF